MYQYEYETVSCDLEGWGFGSGNIYSIEDYRSIISERAKMEICWMYTYKATRNRTHSRDGSNF